MTKRIIEFTILLIAILAIGFVLNTLVIDELPLISFSERSYLTIMGVMMGVPTVIGAIILAIMILNWRSLVEALKAIFRNRMGRDRGGKPRSYLYAILIYLAILVAVLIITRRVNETIGVIENRSFVDAEPPRLYEMINESPLLRGIGVVGIWLYVAIVVAFGVIFILAIYEFSRRTGMELELDEAMRRELEDIVEDALDRYSAGGDIRSIIIATYLRIVELIRKRGVKEDPNETVREYRRRVVSLLPLPKDYMDSITHLFEEARYSDHVLGQEHIDMAVEALEGIRRYLEDG